MFESVSLLMQQEKNMYGTSVKYLGVVLDTVGMRMRIDETHVLGTKLLLKEVLLAIRKQKKVGYATLYHLAVKLNRFSEVLQSGRLHAHSFWNICEQTASAACYEPPETSSS